MIRYSCPSCRLVLLADDHEAGSKVSCPTCGQHLEVPPVPARKTVVGTPLPDAPPEARPGRKEREVPEAQAAPARRRRREPPPDEYDDYDDEPRYARRSRRAHRHGFRCPYCRSDELPLVRSQISQGGWVVFIVLLIFFFPLCWIGLLITETYRTCRDCGMRLNY